MNNALGLLKQRRFLPLFVTQFLGAFNDNLFKHAMVLFATYQLFRDPASEQNFNALATGLAILPFVLLSALSVGIGFGLQAITQNFVSGLILLAERPIKIGDLIRVGTDEGDVKRISVRSTEITLADHSTLIVPNSELITKSVLNKTLASPLGRIQIQFSVPLGTDAARVRALVLDAFAREEDVLADPAPAAFVDSIVDGRIAFNCFAHVPSPRAAYGARSNVLLEILTRFRAEGIEMGTVPQRLELVTAPTDPVPPLPTDPAGGTARP